MTARACWNCGRASERLHFCEHCESLQPPAGDYFQYLDVPRKLRIDPRELENRFYSLSRRLHPDNYFERPEPERRLSEQVSAWLNEAYRTLKDPVARAGYLLRLHGIDKHGESVPPGLLEDVFEIRLILERARAGDASARRELGEARSRFQQILEHEERSLESAFDEWDEAGRRETLKQISGILHRRSFISSLLDEMNATL